MTVKELIEELQQEFDDNDIVYIIDAASFDSKPLFQCPDLMEITEIERYTNNKVALYG